MEVNLGEYSMYVETLTIMWSDRVSALESLFTLC